MSSQTSCTSRLSNKAQKARPVLRDVFENLTSDSVALAGASLGAGLGPALGAGLRAGSAGAGGAAAAGPLQRALHDGLRPPQVRVAAGGQNREHHQMVLHAPPGFRSFPPHPGQLEGEETPPLWEKTRLRSSLWKLLSLQAPLKSMGAQQALSNLIEVNHMYDKK